MKIYLVGGAVRDKLLGFPVKEKDWVVVGATAAQMLEKKFRSVGKDFPVFLHPETQEEYALARTERKVGRGYTGFDFNASPDVTLEEDLARRDLTINAMAETAEGELIDPYHGRDDLARKILRHVSPAFVEDPVRILRVARFAARYASLGFVVAPETIQLMKKMVSSGEVNALVAERVWKELARALAEKTPEKFFQVLADSDALATLFPELSLTSLGMEALVRVAKQSSDPLIRFAALLHDLSSEKVKSFCERFRVPNEYRELALLCATYFSDYCQSKEMDAKQLLHFFKAVDAFRREQRFDTFLSVCQMISSMMMRSDLLRYVSAAKKVDVQSLIAAGFSGKILADEIDKIRTALIAKEITD